MNRRAGPYVRSAAGSDVIRRPGALGISFNGEDPRVTFSSSSFTPPLREQDRSDDRGLKMVLSIFKELHYAK